ncbi:MAG: GNAT family N-acetyltransferase [candidate division Zixibacteria bacterium]
MAQTNDKKKLITHFRKDPVLFAYHIGDLDDFFFPLCQWPARTNDNDEIEEAILIYNNPLFVTVMAFGLTESYEPFLQREFEHFPKTFFCHFQDKYRDIFKSKYNEEPFGKHLKMKLGKFTKQHDDNDKNIIRLSMNHLDMIEEFYSRAYPDGYFDPRMLKTNKYFGYIENEILQSVAGLHVYSDEYKIAVLGSIATHPDYRGRGLATKVTSKLARELSAENKLVCLNVKADNIHAVKCYGKIGFDIVHEYEEARFSKRT